MPPPNPLALKKPSKMVGNHLAENGIWQPGGNLWEDHDYGQSCRFNDGKGDHRSVDVSHGYGGWHNTLEVKKIEAEWWRHIPDFHIDGKQNPEPYGIKSLGLDERQKYGNGNHHDACWVQHHRQNE
jgi:hypothetical protein